MKPYQMGLLTLKAQQLTKAALRPVLKFASIVQMKDQPQFAQSDRNHHQAAE